MIFVQAFLVAFSRKPIIVLSSIPLIRPAIELSMPIKIHFSVLMDIQHGLTDQFRRRKFNVIIWGLLLFLLPLRLSAQQALEFAIAGQQYRTQFSWVLKHVNTEYRAKPAFVLDRAKNANFDLIVSFSFDNDSLPVDKNVVWGFQFRETGGLILPASNAKRSRSAKQFQRFTATGIGNAGLTIVPMVWKIGGGGLEVLSQGNPVPMNFNFVENPLEGDNGLANPLPNAGANQTRTDSPAAAPAPVPGGNTEDEAQAYAEAKSEPDTLRKIKALIDFVDKFAEAKPGSPLVAKAIKDIPLRASIPEKKGGNTYTYTLNYAVNPVVDTSHVRGWQWRLSQGQSGKYQLVLTDLKDSVHSFRIADLGKNAPFNRPRDLKPLERVLIRYLGETSDSFRVQASGGNAPFIVFLSQNGYTKERYIIEKTDQIWTFAKDVCQQCGNGPHTLEVYENDLSTLLLREPDAVHIQKLTTWMLLLGAVGLAFAAWLLLVWFPKFWKRYRYVQKLRDIEQWEEKEARESGRNRRR